jgi:ferredoxin
MKAKVDKSLCIGCGNCVSVYPEGFEMEDDGKSHYIDSVEGDAEKIQEAIDECPVAAISEA